MRTGSLPRSAEETNAAPLLAANLGELARRQPRLAERIALPCAGEHVRFDADGGLHLRLHMDELPLVLDARAVEAALRGAGAAPLALAFGVGAGELLAALLARPGVERVVAWERDPWLLRVALSRHDFTRDLRLDRLRLALGADLADERGPRPDRAVVEHPLLASVYAHERRLLAAGAPARPVAAVGVGGLFVDDLLEVLGEEGWTCVPLDLERWALEELRYAVAKLRPELLATINYRDGLAEFCDEAGVPLVCWEIDPTTSRLRPLERGGKRASIFTWRRRNVASFRAAGFERVEHLPLAANVAQRRPLASTAEERAPYDVPVAFVGASMVDSARGMRGRFLQQYARWRGGDAAAAARAGDALLQAALDEQLQQPERYTLPERLLERFPDFLAAAGGGAGEDPVLLAAEVAAAEKRLLYVAALGRFGLHVWGDEGWRATEPYGVRYRGLAGHRVELNRIYCGARIQLDVGRIYQSDIVTMRVFDVLACGGFLLAERSEELEELFEVGVELEAYRDLAELEAKLEHYLARPEAARRIAERGRAAVLERHTVRARVRHALAGAGLAADASGGA